MGNTNRRASFGQRRNDSTGNRGNGSGNIDFKVTQMLNMGFDSNSSRIALQQCNGDLEQAIAFILRQKHQEEMVKKASFASGSRAKDTNGTRGPQSHTTGNSEGVRNYSSSREAMLAAAENRMTWRQTGKTSNAKKSNKRKNMSNANGISKQLSSSQGPQNKSGTEVQKPIEKKLTKQAKILAANPVALDTCVTIIKTIRDNPKNEKYRKLRWANKKFERTIRYTPGATDFLILIGFTKTEEHLYMPRVDIGLLYVASSVLEDQKRGKTYKDQIKVIEFNRITELLTTTAESALTPLEISKRKEYSQKCPAEPSIGEGEQTKITFVISEKRFSRRFPSDCSLHNSILNWLGTLSSIIPAKIISGEWILMNTTMFPSKPMEFCESRNKTLYALKLWPSGTVELSMAQSRGED
eukprot:g14605.t1